jgi:uncharacterized protein (DUF342 family)
MKLMTVEAADEASAQVKLAQQLGIGMADLKFVNGKQKKFSFEVLNCPASIEVEITRDGMKAFIKRLSLPIGENAPRLDVNFVVQELHKYGVKMGIKRDVISSELLRILKTPGYDDSKPMSLLVAEGMPAVAGSTGRPKWMIDIKLFEKNIPLYVRKGEVLASAPHATVPKDGFKVAGEVIPAAVEEQFKLNIGQGINVVKSSQEISYTAATFGRLFFDQGIRLRVEPKVLDMDDGMVAGVETNRQTITGLQVRPEDLLEMVKDQRVTFGFLSPSEVAEQMRIEKKWPAIIRVARGKLPEDGQYGEVVFNYKSAASNREIDILKAKKGVVFPGEVVLTIGTPKEPVPGKTIFGESLRGRVVDDLPIYPGKNINRERGEAGTVFRSTFYGVVKQDKERVWVENALKISPDKMSASLELFPQFRLTSGDMINLLRDADILLPPNKEELEIRLKEAFEKAERIEDFVVVLGKPPQVGTDAKLIYRFNPEVFKDKGLFQKKAEPKVFAMPGDLMLTKILPVPAKDGINVYREKIPLAASSEPKDVEIKVGDGVEDRQVGQEEDAKNPLRLEFRSEVFGLVSWKDRAISVRSSVEIDSSERAMTVGLSARSDFGTTLTEELLRKAAEAENIRVELDLKEVQKALLFRRPADGSLIPVVLAKAIEPKHGVNASIQYFVDINDKSIETLLGSKNSKMPALVSTDCVRPNDVLATKRLASRGEDGKSIFGRKLPADVGKDEPWYVGDGVDKSPDGTQIFSKLKGPGFVFVEQGKLVVRPTVSISKDKMSATVSIYPTKNPRFPLREDKIISMLTAAGVTFGIKTDAIRATVTQVLTTGQPALDVVVAEGVKPTKGQDGACVLAVDVGSTVGEIRDDGSVDFKNRHIFLSVRKGQLLMIKRPPQLGEDGHNVVGEKLPALIGSNATMQGGIGVEISSTGLEFRAAVDGIVEIKSRSIRVIEGLLIPDDVSFKTGHIDAGASDLFIRGNVLPDFQVRSEGEINIEKVAEACMIIGGSDIRVKGGIIGRSRAIIKAEKDVETIYISGGATVEVKGNLVVGTEILNSAIRVAGNISCVDGAGTICGGEVWVFGNLKVRTLGAPGSETQTVVRLGEHFFQQRDADQEIAQLRLNEQIAELESQIKDLSQQMSKEMNTPEGEALKGLEFQEKYKGLAEQKQELQRKLDELIGTRTSILEKVPHNSSAVLTATEMIYPGVTIMHKDVVWVLKEPQKSVEVRWNSPTSNLISKRI